MDLSMEKPRNFPCEIGSIHFPHTKRQNSGKENDEAEGRIHVRALAQCGLENKFEWSRFIMRTVIYGPQVHTCIISRRIKLKTPLHALLSCGRKDSPRRLKHKEAWQTQEAKRTACFPKNYGKLGAKRRRIIGGHPHLVTPVPPGRSHSLNFLRRHGKILERPEQARIAYSRTGVYRSPPHRRTSYQCNPRRRKDLNWTDRRRSSRHRA
ncbi:unnamed protein product [Prunus armeniaca]|uniref:Uncharacterized protein n=1 Tax=Prunus armeniaca TaxID=36596 RepID=A0A6J5Y528_PRUAR|nr:unnamed protein product [Prunus armeniaca]CAB4319533.1 unnamed protein product [Prunus armeniaca]